MMEILDYLNRLPHCFAWENLSTGNIVNGRITKRHGFQILGSADILCCFSGKFVAFEVKTPNRRENTSDHQKAFLNKINRTGGVAEVVTSVEETSEALRKHGLAT